MNRATDRLTLYKHQLNSPNQANLANPTMDRDPITCHVLNTLTGTPAANLPVMLSLLASPSTGNDNNRGPDRTPLLTYHATTDADGRVKNWTSSSSTANVSASASTTSVPDLLAALPAPDSSTTWSVRFDVGPWYAAQGVESLWPEVEVRFVVKGRGGRDGEGGGKWRHYHVPLLLGPWSYSTYRGS